MFTIADTRRFLWVDYQLLQLCDAIDEEDIRARLGKLPENLSGVYDEIMNSMKPIDSDLATRALKWMLVSQRPLKPHELVAATVLDPSSAPPDRSATQTLQFEQLGIERVVEACGGLILLDQQIGGMRFAHPSVQEYLEKKKDSWGIIDAQRFVSEACLWTLQCTEISRYKHTLGTRLDMLITNIFL